MVTVTEAKTSSAGKVKATFRQRFVALVLIEFYFYELL